MRSIKRLFSGELIIGAGDGTLDLAVEVKEPVIPAENKDVKLPSIPALKILKTTNVNSAVTSIEVR